MNLYTKKDDLNKIWDRKWGDISIDDINDQLKCWIEPHEKIVDKYLKLLKPDSYILDAGCGLGEWVFYCYKKGFHVVGVDVAEKTITRLNNYISCKGMHLSKIQFIEDDIRKMGKIKSNFCDIILNFGVLEHIRNNTIILDQFHRILKRGGFAIITVPNLYSTLTITKPISELLGLWTIERQKHYSRKRLRKIMPLDKFEIIEEGTLVTTELFGTFAKFIPLVGNRLLMVLHRISKFIESRSNFLGFMRFVVIRKL